jgi:hypothetical protein
MKLLYLCIFLLATNCPSFSFAAEEGWLGWIARRCIPKKFSDPREAAPVVERITVRPAKTLEDWVYTWRVCRAYKNRIIPLPKEYDSNLRLFDDEDAAVDFINASIRDGLSDDQTNWLKIEVLRTDPFMGRTAFPGLNLHEFQTSRYVATPVPAEADDDASTITERFDLAKLSIDSWNS